MSPSIFVFSSVFYDADPSDLDLRCVRGTAFRLGSDAARRLKSVEALFRVRLKATSAKSYDLEGYFIQNINIVIESFNIPVEHPDHVGDFWNRNSGVHPDPGRDIWGNGDGLGAMFSIRSPTSGPKAGSGKTHNWEPRQFAGLEVPCVEIHFSRSFLGMSRRFGLRELL